MTTTRLLASGVEVICPDWCDNHLSGQPHVADLHGVLHRQFVGCGAGWDVEVIAADDGHDGARPQVHAVAGPDFEELSELRPYIDALTFAADVVTAAGGRC